MAPVDFMLPISPLENELLFNKSEDKVQTLITLMTELLNREWRIKRKSVYYKDCWYQRSEQTMLYT